MRVTNTNDVEAKSINALIYGEAGSGKTTLASTAVRVIIISAEGGLLSLAGEDIRVLEVANVADVREAYKFCLDEANPVQEGIDLWVIMDSMTEVAEKCLAQAKRVHNDPRAAYLETQETMMGLLRAFRDAPFHFVSIAQLGRVADTDGLVYGPALPGRKLEGKVPYLFDLVLPLRVRKDKEGDIHRWLQTQPDGRWQAKSRTPSGIVLPAEMEPDLEKLALYATGKKKLKKQRKQPPKEA